MSEENINNTEVSAETATQLTIVDLQNIRSIFDVACRRGAFSAAEMSSVGKVFDKLNSFLSTVTEQPSTTE
jgi:hypothetical protein